MSIWSAFVIKFLLFELIPGILLTNFAAISDSKPVTHNNVAIINKPWIIKYAENLDSPMLIDKVSAARKFLIGDKKGRNSRERKRKGRNLIPSGASAYSRGLPADSIGIPLYTTDIPQFGLPKLGPEMGHKNAPPFEQLGLSFYGDQEPSMVLVHCMLNPIEG